MKSLEKKLTRKELEQNLDLMTQWLKYVVNKLKRGEKDGLSDYDLRMMMNVVEKYGIKK